MNDMQALLDKNEITELLTRYMRAIDRGDIATLRASYAPDATEEHGGMYAGPAQGYIDTIERALINPRLVSTHTISNLLIEVAGDEAPSEHYVLALTRVKADGVVSDGLVATRIVDDLVRHEGRWAIAGAGCASTGRMTSARVPRRGCTGRWIPPRCCTAQKYPDDIVYDA